MTTAFAPNVFLALATNYVLGANNTKLLAQVTLVDWRGQTVLDVYVQPTSTIVDYRTSTHGLDARHLAPPEALPYSSVRVNVAEMINNHVIVGHALWSSLALLGLTHPAIHSRDVATYTPFRRALGYPLDSCSSYPALKDLVQVLMRRDMEPLFVNTTETARAAMDLFRSHRPAWEGVITSGGWPSVVLPAYWNIYFT